MNLHAKKREVGFALGGPLDRTGVGDGGGSWGTEKKKPNQEFSKKRIITPSAPDDAAKEPG